jgi:propionyl-CoA carboxylase alpha chain
MPSGWRNNPAGLQRAEFDGHGGRIRVEYRFDRTGRCAVLVVDGDPSALEVRSATPDVVVLVDAGVDRRYRVHRVGGTSFVDGPDGASALAEVERFPLPGSQLGAGSLVAPLPGTVVKVHVGVGDTVEAGDTLVAIEAMKMEHEVHTPLSGTVSEVHVASGDQVEAGRLLVVVEEEEPS